MYQPTEDVFVLTKNKNAKPQQLIIGCLHSMPGLVRLSEDCWLCYTGLASGAVLCCAQIGKFNFSPTRLALGF